MCSILLLLITVPTLELYLLLKIDGQIGTLYTFMLIICTGIVGSILARTEGWKTLRKIKEELSQGKIPGKVLLDGLLILIGGILLITPGVLTDIVGFLAVIPGSRYIFRELLIKILKNKVHMNLNFGIVDIDPQDVHVRNTQDAWEHGQAKELDFGDVNEKNKS